MLYVKSEQLYHTLLYVISKFSTHSIKNEHVCPGHTCDEQWTSISSTKKMNE